MVAPSTADARRAQVPARAASDPPQDADKPPKRKLKFDLDLGQVLGAIKRGEGALNLPPGRVGLFGARETFEYLADPNAFISSRVAKYGPVFKTGFFFKPAIVFGSRAAVEEYKTFESTLPADAALPETFRELHTQYGALRQAVRGTKPPAPTSPRCWADPRSRTTRPSSRARRAISCRATSRRAGRFSRGTTSVSFVSDRSFSSSSAPSRPKTLMDRMYAYNEGLLALGKLSPGVRGWPESPGRAHRVLSETLPHRPRAGQADRPRVLFPRPLFSQATDENGDLFSDERIATTCVLMIWGAYIEAAASMGHTMWCLMRHPEAAEKVRAECRAAFTAEDLRDARLSLDDVYAKLKYTEAATKEALRVVPQTAGGLRVNPTPRTLAGYDVPAGYVLTADPRVAFLDEERFSGAGSVPARTVSRHERERSGRVLPGRDGAAQVSGDIALDAHDSDFSDVRDVDVRRMVARPRGRGVRRSRVHPGAHRHHRR